MEVDVYGVGNALVDIQARVSDEDLARLEFAKGIMTLVDEATQQRVLDQLGDLQTNRCAGGSAANTIMGLADMGGRAAYAGKVANDEMGDFFLSDMRQAGIMIDVPRPDEQTGTCVVLITSDAQRTMLTNLAVSATLGPDDINEDQLAAAKYIYIEGYLMTADSTKAAAMRAIELAKKNNVKIALTLSDPFLIDLLGDELWELIRGPVDLLFCNEDEARSLTGLDEVIECAREIHRHVENVALTMGENGSIVMHEGEVIQIDGVAVDAVDTTGAGDMYAAGILYGITNGLSWNQSGQLGSHAAARIVAQLGARLQQPLSRQQIEEMTA